MIQEDEVWAPKKPTKTLFETRNGHPFLAALFAEDLGREAIEVQDDFSDENIEESGETRPETKSEWQQQFKQACESNTLSLDAFDEVPDEEFSSTISQEGLLNLATFISEKDNLDLELEPLLHSVFKDAEKVTKSKEFQAKIWITISKNESLVVKVFLGLWIDSMMCKPETIDVKFVQNLVKNVTQQENKIEIAKQLLKTRVLNDSNLGILDGLLLKENLLQSCSKLPEISVQLSVLIHAASEGGKLSKSTKFGMFMVGALKRLPKELPKQCQDLFSKAIEYHQSFYKKVADSELRKHS